MCSFINSKLLSVLLLSSQVCFSGTMGPTNSEKPYDGFYIGADLGVSDFMLRNHTTATPDTHTLGSLGVVGGGLIGYDYSLRTSIKLGLEGFMNATGLNVAANQNYNGNPSFRGHLKYNVGFRLLPGYEISPGTISYALIGYSNGRFNIRDNGDYGFISDSFNRSGIQGGLGLKTILYKNLSIRGDLLYSYYDSQTNYGLTNTSPQLVQTYQSRLSTFEGDLTLVYKFS